MSEAPAPFGASALAPRADEGITAQSEAITPAPAPVASPSPAPAPAPDDVAKASDPAKASAATAAPSISVACPRRSLVTVASGAAANGHANGNGNGKRTLESFTGSLSGGGGQKVAFAAQADAPSCAECGSIMIRNGSAATSASTAGRRSGCS